MATIVLARSWPSPRWLRTFYNDNAEDGVAWVERRKAAIIAAFSAVHVRVCGGSVTGICNTGLYRRRGRHRPERRIRATVPARYPHLTFHSETGAPIRLDNAAEAVVFILGHETSHVWTGSERRAEDQGLRWLSDYRLDVGRRL